MLQSVQKFCSKKLLKLRARASAQSEMIDVSSQVIQIKSALILLPEDTETLQIAVEKLDELRGLFKNAEFHYIILSTSPFDYPAAIVENATKISKNDLTIFGAPSKTFLYDYSSKNFDILIDLNIEFNAFATYLARSTNTRLRVCLSSPDREPFYNLQINA
ncbi:MAG: hypothetical protein DWQ10_07565, partial [Calditrichaeota bacterium]